MQLLEFRPPPDKGKAPRAGQRPGASEAKMQQHHRSVKPLTQEARRLAEALAFNEALAEAAYRRAVTKAWRRRPGEGIRP
jgi:hypothetical protein